MATLAASVPSANEEGDTVQFVNRQRLFASRAGYWFAVARKLENFLNFRSGGAGLVPTSPLVGVFVGSLFGATAVLNWNFDWLLVAGLRALMQLSPAGVTAVTA